MFAASRGSFASRLCRCSALLVAFAGTWQAPAACAQGGEDRLVVFAAASLQDVFARVSEDFRRTRPRVEVVFHFAGTQELRTQIERGAVADVFASADRQHMDRLVSDSLVSAPEVFARNEPVIVVATESEARIRGLADLPAARRLVFGAEEVPIGRYTAKVLALAAASLGEGFPAKVEAKVVSRELNVRQVLYKVAIGEADAGIVYRTDAIAASAGSAPPRFAVVSIPAPWNVAAEYPVAAVAAAPHPALAAQWIAHLRSDEGRRALEQAGFSVPAQPAE